MLFIIQTDQMAGKKRIEWQTEEKIKQNVLISQTHTHSPAKWEKLEESETEFRSIRDNRLHFKIVVILIKRVMKDGR